MSLGVPQPVKVWIFAISKLTFCLLTIYLTVTSSYLNNQFSTTCLQYCHYVAGLVGIGLSQLFSASKLEDPEVGQDTELANSMGLFLQKTNIIRDYLEDTQEGRAFWPKEVSSWRCECVCVSVVSNQRPKKPKYSALISHACAGLESVCRPSGGFGPAREAGVCSVLSQPACH